MSFYAFSALINFLTSIGLGSLILSQNIKNKTNQTFAFFTYSVAIWSLGYYFWQVSDSYENAFFWIKFLMAGSIFIAPTYLHFIYTQIGVIESKKKSLFFGYCLFLLFLLFNFFSPLFIQDLQSKLSFKFWPVAGPLYHIFLLVWVSYISYASYLLFDKFQSSEGIKKLQNKYILLGMIVGFIGGSTNYFLWYNISIPPIANISASLNVAIITYGVLKHHIFSTKIMISELLIGGMGVSLLFLVFTSRNLSSFTINFSILLAFILFGILLIREMLVGVEREEHLNKANHDLRSLIQTKDNFLRMTSHQLRTPLTVVNGYLSMLTDTRDVRYKMNKEARDDAMKTYLSSQALLGIVNDLLSANAINSGRFGLNIVGPVNIKEMIQDILDNKKQLFDEYKTDVKFTTQGQSFIGHIDNPKVRETLNNLIDNAVFYGHGKIFVALYDNNDTIMITIKDNGVGVTAEDAKKLWKKFVRGKDSPTVHPNGSGLGLYLARKIVRLHKGTIELHSEGKDKGTEFKISLPKKKTVNLNRNV